MNRAEYAILWLATLAVSTLCWSLWLGVAL